MKLKTQSHEYRPSLICRLVGHNFDLHSRKFIKDEDGDLRCHRTTHVQNFCRRCGIFNPNVLGDDMLRDLLKRELSL